jgi:NADPH:quinone reductase-like Zn-dependent oxidoreductase
MSTRTIQVIRVHQYGGPEQLQLEHIPRPEPQAGEVLLRVHAAGVHPMDWKIRQGLFKDIRPLSFPSIPGAALAGIVEEVGPGVTAFEVGQAMFGQSATGAYAEYVTAPVETLALKPKTLSFDEAATLAGGATTAWQALFDQGKLQAGQRVLIVGAAGGVGSFVVQFAKWKNAQVIATTSTANHDFIHALGAETVIDYTSTTSAQVVHDVDLVIDTVGGEALEGSWSALKRGGTLVSIVSQPSAEKAQQRDAHAVFFIGRTSRALLETIAHVIDEGHIRAVVGRVLPLSEARLAHELVQTGHGRGRIVLHIAD